MANAKIKTTETEASVKDFLAEIADEKVRDDSQKITQMMEKATDEKPKMWGAAIVGYGNRRMKYSSGREVDWFDVGFAPRKQNLTLYLSTGEAWNEELLSKLGKHEVGMGCLYIKRLSDVDEEVSKKLIDESVERAKK